MICPCLVIRFCKDHHGFPVCRSLAIFYAERRLCLYFRCVAAPAHPINTFLNYKLSLALFTIN